MIKSRQHDICVIFILGILCIGVLALMVHIISNSVSNNFNQPHQSDAEVSQDNGLTSDNEREKDIVSTGISSKEIASFSYSQHQTCGVKRNVYCALLDDFTPNSDWKQRIGTITQYIDAELGGGSTNDYLIYFFRDSECYKQKIASKATEMCNIPNGEVATSSWGKIYYEYGEEE